MNNQQIKSRITNLYPLLALFLWIVPPAFSQFPGTEPDAYNAIYSMNFETEQKAADYIGHDAWYFYWGGDGASDNDHPELDKRFKIVQDPLNPDNQALQITKFDGDQDYSGSSSPLNPRAELSFRPSLEKDTDKHIYFRIRTYFPENQRNVFSAEFIQFWLHGSSNIPMQIEVREGHFAARRPGHYKYPRCSDCGFNGESLNNNLNRWITWEVLAHFNQDQGYWKIFMDGNLVFTHSETISDWPDNSGTWHPQFGAYANNGGDGHMEVLFDDFLVAEGSGEVDIPTDPVTPADSNSTLPDSGYKPIEDAYLQSGTGFNDNLLKIEPSNRTSYLKFDLQDMPAGTIQSTRLLLTCTGDAGQGTIRAFSSAQHDWDENNLNQNNAPIPLTEVGSISGAFNPGTTYSIDLGDAISVKDTYTFILEMDAGGNDAWFSSAEGNSPPLLQVEIHEHTTTNASNEQNAYNLNQTNHVVQQSETTQEKMLFYNARGELMQYRQSALPPGVYYMRSTHGWSKRIVIMDK